MNSSFHHDGNLTITTTAITSTTTTTTADDDDDAARRTVAVNAVVGSLLMLVAVTALVGNVVVVLAVFLYHRLKAEVANLFIVNLSITDLSSAAVVMIGSVVAVSADRWVLGSTWCSIVCGANYCFIIVSMLTLCFISVDRYTAIHYSLRYHTHVTKPRVLACIAYSWLQGLLFGLVPMISGWVDYDYWEATCAIQWHIYGQPVLTYVIVAFVLCFLLPGLVLTVAYCKVFRTVKKIKPRPRPAIHLVAHRTQAQCPDSGGGPPNQVSVVGVPQQKAKYSESSKAVRGLLIVVLAYFICMTPFSVTKLYKVCVPHPNALPGYANMLATFFQYAGSAVNPLIYGLFRRDFQQAFLYLLWRLIRHQAAQTSHPSVTASF